jgi:RAB protein geranylgeranyltransferase component A
LRLLCSPLFFSRKYGLDDNTIDFIGHAVALHKEDNYLTEPAIDTVKRMKASIESFNFKILEKKLGSN